MTDLLVRDAELLVTMDGDEVPGGWVAIDGGLVAAVGSAGDEPPARSTLSAAGCLVTPGLVNAHHHLFQNLTRSYAPVAAAPLADWLAALQPVWARLDEEAAYVSAYVGCCELALGGCTTTSDHLYLHPRPGLIDAEIAAAADVGLRFHPTRGAVNLGRSDGALPPDEVVEDHDAILADTARLVDRYHDRSPGAMVRVGVAPSALSVATPELMRDVADLAERLDIRLHTHLAEDADEDRLCEERFGCRSVEQLERLGWAFDRTWVAHCVHPTAAEIGAMGRGGMGVAHCPSSNALLAGGIAPVTDLRAAGVTVGLGCDGSASSDTGSLWLEARTALLLGKLRGGPAAMAARDVLAMATVGSAACLGRGDELGRIRAGRPADLVAWELDPVAFAGAHTDLVEAWLRCGPVRPRHTVVDGAAVVRDGAVQAPGLADALAAHDRIARAWQRAHVL